MSTVFDEAQQSADQVVGSNSATNSDPVIWVRNQQGSGYYGGTPTKAGGYGGTSKVTLSLSQMQNKIRAWAGSRNPQYDQYVDKLVAGNFMSESYRGQSVTAANALANAVTVYSSYSSEGGSLSFDDWFDWYASTSTPDTGGAGGGGGGYSGPTTTVSTTLTDPTTAEAILDKFSRDLLGRALTKKEADRYLKEYRDIEVENPQVTTTTPMGISRRETVTEAAPSKEEMLRQVMAKNPDYQKFQIDTTIMDLLLDDIKAGQEVING